MKKLTKKLSLEALLIIVLWVIGISFGFNSELELYGLLMLVTLMPIVILYAYRQKRKKEIGYLNKVFCFFTSLYIVVSIFWVLSTIIGEYLFYLSWMGLSDFLYYFTPLALMIIILFILKKINRSLMPEKNKQENQLIPVIKINKEVTIAIIAIVFVLIITVTSLVNTQDRVDQVFDWGFDYSISGKEKDLYIQNLYTNMYKQILTFGGFVFASAFLLIYSLNKK
jgi:hypothetical protein